MLDLEKRWGEHDQLGAAHLPPAPAAVRPRDALAERGAGRSTDAAARENTARHLRLVGARPAAGPRPGVRPRPARPGSLPADLAGGRPAGRIRRRRRLPDEPVLRRRRRAVPPQHLRRRRPPAAAPTCSASRAHAARGDHRRSLRRRSPQSGPRPLRRRRRAARGQLLPADHLPAPRGRARAGRPPRLQRHLRAAVQPAGGAGGADRRPAFTPRRSSRRPSSTRPSSTAPATRCPTTRAIPTSSPSRSARSRRCWAGRARPSGPS